MLLGWAGAPCAAGCLGFLSLGGGLQSVVPHAQPLQVVHAVVVATVDVVAVGAGAGAAEPATVATGDALLALATGALPDRGDAGGPVVGQSPPAVRADPAAAHRRKRPVASQ